MPRLFKSIFFITLISFGTTCAFAAEEIVLTTYYPSPYGSYNYLQTDKLGVGDNNGDGAFSSADVPTASGDAWIKGRVGIGNGVASPAQALDVNGTIKANAYQVGATPGISSVMTVRDAGGAGDCSITVVNGIITATTC